MESCGEGEEADALEEDALEEDAAAVAVLEGGS